MQDGPRGSLITFEGGEGAGKSTQALRLAEWLRGRFGREVVVTREPGGTPRAEEIRRVLLSGRAREHGTLAEALLFAAARLDHLDALIRPALERGALVLCDRFMDSTRAYQGAAGGLDSGIVDALERVVVEGTRPVLTIVLDVPAQIGLSRAAGRARQGRADRFEGEALAFHQRLRDAFAAIVAAEPRRCALIDGAADPTAVEAAIRAEVMTRLRLEPGQRVHAA